MKRPHHRSAHWEAALQTEVSVGPKKLAALFRIALMIAVCSAAMFSLDNQASAQICKPISQRTSDVGCWIIAHEPVGQLTVSQIFWHLDAYPSRASAEAAKGPSGTIV